MESIRCSNSRSPARRPAFLAIDGDISRPSVMPSAIWPAYSGIDCQRFCDPGHTGCFFTRQIERSLRHVHVERDQSMAKFWLEPVRLDKSHGLGRTEIGRIERLIAENEAFLLRAWHEYFEG